MTRLRVIVILKVVLILSPTGSVHECRQVDAPLFAKHCKHISLDILGSEAMLRYNITEIYVHFPGRQRDDTK